MKFKKVTQAMTGAASPEAVGADLGWKSR